MTGGAGSCRTTPGQARRVSFGCFVTTTRNCARTTSSGFAASTPISTSEHWQQGQVVASGARTTSMRARSAGTRPARRRLAWLSWRVGDAFPASAAFPASVASISSNPNSNCSSGIPDALRVVVNAIHNVSPKPPAPGSPTTFSAYNRRTASSPRLRSSSEGRSRRAA